MMNSSSPHLSSSSFSAFVYVFVFVFIFRLRLQLSPSSSSSFFVFIFIVRLRPSSLSFAFVFIFRLRLHRSSTSFVFISICRLHLSWPSFVFRRHPSRVCLASPLFVHFVIIPSTTSRFLISSHHCQYIRSTIKYSHMRSDTLSHYKTSEHHRKIDKQIHAHSKRHWCNWILISCLFAPNRTTYSVQQQFPFSKISHPTANSYVHRECDESSLFCFSSLFVEFIFQPSVYLNCCFRCLHHTSVVLYSS